MKIKDLVLFAAISIILTGCWDKIELNDRAFINAIAIDKAEGESRFKIGVAVSDITAYEGNNNSGEDEAANKSIKKSEGRTVSSAIRQFESVSSQKPFFGHTKAVFLGTELLKDKQLFMEAMDSLERDSELSRKMLVLATAEGSVDAIGAKPVGEPSIGVFADNFYKWQESGETFRMTLEDLFISLRSDKNAIIPKITEEDGELSIKGAAVIKNFELCGFLDGKETRGYLWRKSKLKGDRVIVDYEGVAIPFTVERHRKKTWFSEGGGVPIMQTKVTVIGSIDEYIFGEGLQEQEKLRKIEALVGEEIKQEIEVFEKKLKSDMRADATGTRTDMKKKNFALWETYGNSETWQDTFEKMPHAIIVEVKITSTGLIY